MGIEPIRWDGKSPVVLDQSLLPGLEVWVALGTVEDVERAIRTMQVRGAPLLGVTAAFGMVLAARGHDGPPDPFTEHLARTADRLRATRPTAVNLSWAVERMLRRAGEVASLRCGERAEALLAEAEAIRTEDIAMCMAIGRHGAALVADGETVMTHCNAGALATAGYGSALGVLRAAVAQGKRIRVLARETRPLFQGARLTAWELARDGMDVAVVPDAAAAHIMRTGRVDRVIVGADRIAANGDTANKIGTYDLAIIAREHSVPFHVAAPRSTVDFRLADGTSIPIEERATDEVTAYGGVRVTPAGVPALNPSFDVTPARYIESIITDAGVANPPYRESLSDLLRSGMP